MKLRTPFSFIFIMMILAITFPTITAAGNQIIHDAEYYILEAQHGDQWVAEDKQLDLKLAELRERFGQPPNLIHIMWDDTAFGDVGIPAIQQVRGLKTPRGSFFPVCILRSVAPPAGRRWPPDGSRSEAVCTTSACFSRCTGCGMRK